VIHPISNASAGLNKTFAQASATILNTSRNSLK
jgi:hypothetical protein